VIDGPVPCLLALWAVGFVAARRLVRGAGSPMVLSQLEAAGLAPAIGALLASTSFFFAAFVTDRGVTRTTWSVAFAFVAVAFVLLTHRRGPVAEPRLPAIGGSAPAAIAAMITLVLVLVTLAVADIEAMPSWPHGQGDAQAIWNARARLLTRADGDWADRFHAIELGHLDYPLLLPGTIATLWMWSGTEGVMYPQAIAVLFHIGLALVVFTSAWRFGGPLAAALATPFVLWTPHVLFTSLAQLADLPLALFLLVAWSGLASLRLEDPGRRASALAVGAALSGLAWTKNDGIVWAALLAGLWAVMEAVRHRGPVLRRDLGPLLRAAAPVVVALVFFKLSWAPASDIVRDLDAGLLRDLGSWERWRGSLGGVARELSLASSLDWPGIASGHPPTQEVARWAGAWLALGAALVLGVRRRGLRGARDLAYGAWSLGALLAAIVVVYVLTPLDPSWHIQTSMSRLLLHAYPAIVVWVVSAVARSRGESGTAVTIHEPMAA